MEEGEKEDQDLFKPNAVSARSNVQNDVQANTADKEDCERR